MTSLYLQLDCRAAAVRIDEARGRAVDYATLCVFPARL
jgi:hypothetical protein